ncbi:BTB/POZ and MATH domain-containing protein 1-like [Ananas comosus]|uniref:BTB/POZ and MATH domain-containing protein 1-like n=1 Tax=Ananas comosus TaxID=4615 RepID=A0A6P5GMX8_ANACO|nr:BTB/POZ and MATH domain-containing protein 1-like [Ananas comosus]
MSTSAAARSSESLSKWTMEKAIGSHLFHVADYSLARTIGVGKSISSAVFDVGGLDWSIKCYPAGGTPQNSNYLALFLALESDARNVKAAFRLALLDQRMKPSSKTPAHDGPYTFKNRDYALGYHRFVERAYLEASQFRSTDCLLSNDALLVHCTVTVLKNPRLQSPAIRPVAAPPSDLHQHLVRLLESGEGSDVTFEVGGATFAAHRWLLAARSPVFRAELFGPMKENRMRRIKIDDMEAVVFKGLLHFIYSDSLPPLMEELAKESAVLMAQHLLAAADRYGLERLRLICESKLSQQVDAGTVATTLALAEQHHCRNLKAICLNFIDSPEVFIAVMRTDGFEHLKTSCPALLENLLKKLG